MSEVSIPSLCARAKAASRVLATSSREAREAVLHHLVRALRDGTPAILEASARDVDEAKARGTSGALLDRLALDARRVEGMAQAIEGVAALEDPVGTVVSDAVRPSGIRVRRIRVPLGVIAMVYEARPNVTAEASALCLKAGNAVVLRGGSEAARSNAAIVAVVAAALERAGLPRDAVQMLPPGNRDAIRELVQQTETVDLVIPRGGEALIAFVREHARVAVIAHASGVCHLYVDGGADVEMAARLAVNGKLQRPGVCNALECLLVDVADASRLLPPIAAALLEGGCELRADDRARAILAATPMQARQAMQAKPATDADWGREYLDRILAVRVVDGIDGALEHVARYGSRHTEVICTRDEAHAERWRRSVDAACVVVNASSRFHDGGELGLGAEIGIATSKLHWRGAMGLEALTTFQWVVEGAGQTR
jgi:glutamate-5-semialdehyde dehydrogenase